MEHRCPGCHKIFLCSSKHVEQEKIPRREIRIASAPATEAEMAKLCGMAQAEYEAELVKLFGTADICSGDWILCDECDAETLLLDGAYPALNSTIIRKNDG